MERSKIYTILVFTKLEQDEHEWPDFMKHFSGFTIG